MPKLEAYIRDNRIYVPCPWCRVVHSYSVSEPLKCSQLKVIKGQTVHSPYEHGFTVEIIGEYTEAILKKYLSLWRRKRPNLNEDVFY